ncbi:MAG: hypothetical protein CVU05_10745 [Bacteroidetes bacterium HGW-Bacteroidetes-21]|nr:MAG: hypothetical protein CVU05_10745 [Bacteroidetes bacterium HGW-Bacteroidetes-21]
MRKVLITICSILLVLPAFSGEILLDGIFQGKNLYVMNPFASSGVGFCVFEVTINGKTSTDEINSSAFEIDLSVFQFNVGDKVTIAIKHKDNCLPKVLNPEVLKPKSTFTTASINVEKDGTLKWTTSGEAGKLSFIVEQYRWNKWIKVSEVDGKGTSGSNSYTAKVNPHSGNNKFRVKQIDYTKKPRYSTEADFRSPTPPISITSKKFDTEITFSGETLYEIYDFYGNIVLKGLGAKVDITSLKKGDYFINYDNTMDQFKKK